MKLNIKKVAFMMVLAGSVSLTSCDDWTETESLNITNNTIEQAEGYDAYLANLREYRNTNHKQVYAWYNIPSTGPTNQSQRLSAVPDSVDVIVLENPVQLSDFTKEEITKVRENKGMKVVYVVDFDAIKTVYTLRKEVQEVPEFTTFLQDSLSVATSYADANNLDGIIFAYNGKDTGHLDAADLAEYQAQQSTFLTAASTWRAAHSALKFDFMGYPQNIASTDIINSFDYLFIRQGLNATDANSFAYYYALAAADGVPAARLGMVSTCVSADPTDLNTGVLSDGSYSVLALATWAAANPVAAVAVQNAQNDYFNSQFIYPVLRSAISTINPSVKK